MFSISKVPAARLCRSNDGQKNIHKYIYRYIQKWPQMHTRHDESEEAITQIHHAHVSDATYNWEWGSTDRLGVLLEDLWAAALTPRATHHLWVSRSSGTCTGKDSLTILRELSGADQRRYGEAVPGADRQSSSATRVPHQRPALVTLPLRTCGGQRQIRGHIFHFLAVPL